MLQLSTQQLSDQDNRFIETYHLGSPLRVFQLRSGYILLTRIFSLFLQIIAAITFIILLSDIHQLFVTRQDSSLTFHIAVALFPILLMIYCSFSLIPNEQKMHLIICEEGLLQTKKLLVKTQAHVIYWDEVVNVKRGAIFPQEYQIIHQRKHKGFTLFYGYQHYNELLALIKERISAAEKPQHQETGSVS